MTVPRLSPEHKFQKNERKTFITISDTEKLGKIFEKNGTIKAKVEEVSTSTQIQEIKGKTKKIQIKQYFGYD